MLSSPPPSPSPIAATRTMHWIHVRGMGSGGIRAGWGEPIGSIVAELPTMRIPPPSSSLLDPSPPSAPPYQTRCRRAPTPPPALSLLPAAELPTTLAPSLVHRQRKWSSAAPEFATPAPACHWQKWLPVAPALACCRPLLIPSATEGERRRRRSGSGGGGGSDGWRAERMSIREREDLIF